MASLEFVSMPQNGINPPGITALAKSFAFNTNLRHVNLCDNTCTVSGAQALAQVCFISAFSWSCLIILFNLFVFY